MGSDVSANFTHGDNGLGHGLYLCRPIAATGFHRLDRIPSEPLRAVQALRRGSLSEGVGEVPERPRSPDRSVRWLAVRTAESRFEEANHDYTE